MKRTKKHPESKIQPHDDGSVGPDDPGLLAWKKVEARAGALASEKVPIVRTDVGSACSIAMNAVPIVRGFRARIAEALPEHPIGCVDHLETLSRATWHLYVTQGKTSQPKVLRTLIQQGTPLRGKLATAAKLLAEYGLLPAEEVAEIARPQGKKTHDLAHDLSAYASLMRKHWEAIQNNTPVREQDLAEAASLGVRILAADGAQKKTTKSSKGAPKGMARETITDLERCFCLMAEAYDECRRAVTYLRWHEGDADTLLPSLFARGKKGAKAAGTPQAPVVPPPPTPPTGPA